LNFIVGEFFILAADSVPLDNNNNENQNQNQNQ
jgi:hypothetical protein